MQKISFCKFPPFQEHCCRALTDRSELQRRMNSGQHVERSFVFLSPSASAGCAGSDCSLRRRFRKQGNEERGEEKAERALCPSLATCLNSLNTWELRCLPHVIWPLSITKVTLIPATFRPFYMSFTTIILKINDNFSEMSFPPPTPRSGRQC